MVGRDGFGPSKAKPTDLQSVAFDRSATYPFCHSNMVVIMPLAGHYLGVLLLRLELVVGIEPTTG